MSYTPNQSKYLTVSQAKNNSGTKDIKIILDLDTNTFYTLDDDGNFLPITSTPTPEWTESEITLLDTDILNLGNSPIELLAAPGIGTYYVFESIIFEFTYGTSAYTLNEPLYIYNGGAQFQLADSIITLQVDNVIVVESFVSDTFVDTDTYIYYLPKTLNEPLTIGTWNGTNPTGGDGTLKVKMKYKIKTFG
jgi:hypothetical protein